MKHIRIGIGIDEKAEKVFLETCKWAKIVSIIGLVLFGCWFLFNFGILLFTIFTKGIHPYAYIRVFNETFYNFISVSPYYFLFRFSFFTKSGIINLDKMKFAKGMKSLKLFCGFLAFYFFLSVMNVVIAVVYDGWGVLGI